MGWENDLTTPPTAAPSPAASGWDADTTTPPWADQAPQKRFASGIAESLVSGFQGGAVPLAYREKLPDLQLNPQDSHWYERAAAGVGQLAGDFPAMVAGGMYGAGAGSAVAPGIGTVLGGSAGAFALPAAIREAYTLAIKRGQVTSATDWLDRAQILLKETGKQALVGVATGVAGKAATALSAGYGASAGGALAATLAAEGGTMVVTPALLEGRLPDPQEALDAAILLGGMKAAHSASTKIMDTFSKTGRTPAEVVADAQLDPQIQDDIVTPTESPPEIKGWKLTAATAVAPDGVATSADLVGKITTQLGPDHFVSVLMDKLAPRLKDYNVEVLPESEWKYRGYSNYNNAEYDPKTNTLRFKNEINMETAVHEVLHEATAVELKLNPAFNEDIEVIMRRVREATATGEITDIPKRDMRRLKKAMEKPAEFVAYGLSSPEVINILRGVRGVGQQPTMFTTFVATVAKAFGFEPKHYSALHDLVRAVEVGVDTSPEYKGNSVKEFIRQEKAKNSIAKQSSEAMQKLYDATRRDPGSISAETMTKLAEQAKTWPGQEAEKALRAVVESVRENPGSVSAGAMQKLFGPGAESARVMEMLTDRAKYPDIGAATDEAMRKLVDQARPEAPAEAKPETVEAAAKAVETSRETVKDLSAELEAATKALEASNAKAEVSGADLNEANARNDLLEKKLVEATARIEELSSKLGELEGTTVDREKYRALQDENEALLDTLENLSTDLEDLKKQSKPPEPEREIPRAYEQMAREERLKETVPDPELMKKADLFIKNPQAKVPQLPGEPILQTHVNYNYIDTPEQVKEAFSRLSELQHDAIQKAQKGRVGWSETVTQAKEMLEDMAGEKFDGLLSGQVDLDRLAAHIYAVKMMLQSGVEQLYNMRETYVKARDQGMATDVMRLELLAQFEKVSSVLTFFRGGIAEIGRAQNILKNTKRDKAFFDQMDGLLTSRFSVDGKNFGANFDEMVDRMGDLDTLGSAAKFVDKAAKATKWEMFMEAWKAGAVSGPITQLANVSSNAFGTVARPLVDFVAAAVGRATSAEERVYAYEGLARWKGNKDAFFDACRLAQTVFRDGVRPGTGTDTFRNAIPGKIGTVVRTPFRALSSADTFFRVMIERGEAYALASRKLIQDGYMPFGAEFDREVRLLADNPTDAMKAQIAEVSDRFTFNAPMGKRVRSFQQAIKGTPLEIFVPFVQTPVNVTKELGRMTPLAWFVPEWQAAFKKGGPEGQKALAESMIGVGFGLATMAAFGSGNITGQLSADPKKRSVEMTAGKQPYSFKYGDKWYSYQRFPPFGTLIGIYADIMTAWEDANDNERANLGKIFATAFAQAVTNQTFLAGVTNAVNILSQPDQNLERFFKSYAASMVPGFIAQTNQLLDPYVRETNTIFEAIQARIPGASQMLLPKRDALGEPVQTKQRFGFISPITVTTESNDRVLNELARLEIGVTKTPDHIDLPAMHDKRLGRLDLTPAERDVFATKSGQFAHKVLGEIMSQPDWDQTPDVVQKEIVASVFKDAREFGRAEAIPPEKIEKKMEEISAKLQDRLKPK